jgi:heptosyltransferase-1
VVSDSRGPKILVVKLSAMGDIIHALPAVNLLKRLLPQSEIHWLIGQRWSPLLEGVRCVERVLTLKRGFSGYLDAVKSLRANHYHAAIDLQGLLKSSALTACSGASVRAGFDTAFAREPVAALFYNIKVSPKRTHIVEQLMDLVEEAVSSFGGVHVKRGASDVRWGLVPTEAELQHARQTLSSLGLSEPFAVILPGTGWETKTWHPDKFVELARLINKAFLMPTLAVWGPGEEDMIPEGEGIFVAPPTNLREMMALLRMASLVVGGDTGPLHMAVALGVPVVGLYGPTLPERNGPYSNRCAVVVKECPNRGQHKRRCSQPCVESIEVDQVFSTVESLIGAI